MCNGQLSCSGCFSVLRATNWHCWQPHAYQFSLGWRCCRAAAPRATNAQQAEHQSTHLLGPLLQLLDLAADIHAVLLRHLPHLRRGHEVSGISAGVQRHPAAARAAATRGAPHPCGSAAAHLPDAVIQLHEGLLKVQHRGVGRLLLDWTKPRKDGLKPLPPRRAHVPRPRHIGGIAGRAATRQGHQAARAPSGGRRAQGWPQRTAIGAPAVPLLLNKADGLRHGRCCSAEALRHWGASNEGAQSLQPRARQYSRARGTGCKCLRAPARPCGPDAAPPQACMSSLEEPCGLLRCTGAFGGRS